MKIMKTIVLSVMFLLTSALSFSQSSFDNNGKSMKPILSDMDTVIKLIEAKDWEIVKLEYDIVKKDVEKNSYRVLTSDYTYRIYVLGDYRTSNMNLSVYKQKADGTYEYVKMDTENSGRYAMVDISPSETTWYKFVVTCSEFSVAGKDAQGNNLVWVGGHYGLMVFHQ